MRVKINPKMFSKNSCPMTLEIEGSTELAYYVKRSGNFYVYSYAGKLLALDMKEVHAKS